MKVSKIDILNFSVAGLLGANIATAHHPVRNELTSTKTCQHIIHAAEASDEEISNGRLHVGTTVARILEVPICKPGTPINPMILKTQEAWIGTAIGETVMAAIYAIVIGMKGSRKKKKI